MSFLDKSVAEKQIILRTDMKLPSLLDLDSQNRDGRTQEQIILFTTPQSRVCRKLQ
jgi:hypothetical protein